MTSSGFFRATFAATVLLGSSALTTAAMAQTWQGTDSAQWNEAGNWTNDNLPNSDTAIATFDDSVSTGSPVIVNGPITVNRIELLSGMFEAEGIGELQFAGVSPRIDVADDDALTLDVKSSSATTLEKVGTGRLSLHDEFDGSILVSDGTLDLGYEIGSDESTPKGDVTGNVDVAVGATLSTNAPLIQVGSLSGGGTVALNFTDLTIGSDDSDSTFSGQISGTGLLIKSGAGVFTLSGTNNLGMQVSEGGVVVTGTVTGLTSVSSGTWIGGGGTLQNLTVTGGTLSPGTSIGTLTMQSLSLDSDSTYLVEVDGGSVDRVNVTGNAELGGATVFVTSPGDNANVGTYTILEASTISGAFGSVENDLVLLDAKLMAYSDRIDIVLNRNTADFVQPGQNDNQQAVAMAIEDLGSGNPLFDSVVANYVDGEDFIFDQYSGESFASQLSAFLQQSAHARGITLDRVKQAFAALGDTSGFATSYVGGTTQDPAMAPAIWGTAYGSVGVISDTTNSAAVNMTSGGLFVGIDGLVNGWRLGALANVGVSGTGEAALDASTTSMDFGAGVYGGTEWGPTSLSLGANFVRHAVISTRRASVSGADQTLTGNFGAGTAQVFGELAHTLEFDSVSLQPFVRGALVSVSRDGFTEIGGSAALTSAASNSTFGITNLGLNAEKQFVLGDDMLLHASVGASWQHVFGADPSATNNFSGGDQFTVTGAPIARDAALLEAGLMLDVSENLTFGLNYEGQVSTTSQDHSANFTIAGSF